MKLIKKVFIFGVIILSQILLNAEAAPKCGGNPGGNDPACWTSQKETCKWTTIGTIYHCKKDNILCSDGYSNNDAQSCSKGRCDTHGGKGSLYGYFKKGNCSGLWCTNKSEPKPVVRYTCHYIDKYNNWTQCVNGVQIGKNPHWTTRSGTNCSNVSSTKSCPMCTGTLPIAATKCPNADSNLTKDVAWHKVADCTGASKCSYTKKVDCGPKNNTNQTTLTSSSLGLCNAPGVVSNFDDAMTEFDGDWTWGCVKSGYDSAQCLAHKFGSCAPTTNAPYNDKEKACKEGHINSVSLNNGIFSWKCGTNGGASLGSFVDSSQGAQGITLNATPDTYAPTDCQCTAGYTYYCSVQSANCTDKCGEMATEIHIPFKKETACFPTESSPISVTRDDYATNLVNHASGQPATCENKQVHCPPCGVNAGESGVINETN
jgi:hypothetical protein